MTDHPLSEALRALHRVGSRIGGVDLCFTCGVAFPCPTSDLAAQAEAQEQRIAELEGERNEYADRLAQLHQAFDDKTSPDCIFDLLDQRDAALARVSELEAERDETKRLFDDTCSIVLAHLAAIDEGTYECTICGAGHDQDHRPGCRIVAAQHALEQHDVAVPLATELIDRTAERDAALARLAAVRKWCEVPTLPGYECTDVVDAAKASIPARRSEGGGVTNLDYEAWRCQFENDSNRPLFCPPDGCPLGACVRERPIRELMSPEELTARS